MQGGGTTAEGHGARAVALQQGAAQTAKLLARPANDVQGHGIPVRGPRHGQGQTAHIAALAAVDKLAGDRPVRTAHLREELLSQM